MTGSDQSAQDQFAAKPGSGEKLPVLLVGAGRMGQAFLKGWRSLAEPSFFDPGIDQLAGARKLELLEEVVNLPRPLTILVAVKPQMLPTVLPRLAEAAGGPDILFVSIAAGAEIGSLRAHLGECARIVRAMPNTPVAVGRGVTAAVAGEGVSAEQQGVVERLFGAVGELIWLDEEVQLDAVTAVSGSGPAYFFRFAEALAEAGVSAGLERSMALRLARATLAGAGAVAAPPSASLAELRADVTSPGGTTAAALRQLEAAGLDAIVARAVEAALDRAHELAEENRQ